MWDLWSRSNHPAKLSQYLKFYSFFSKHNVLYTGLSNEVQEDKPVWKTWPFLSLWPTKIHDCRKQGHHNDLFPCPAGKFPEQNRLLSWTLGYESQRPKCHQMALLSQRKYLWIDPFRFRENLERKEMNNKFNALICHYNSIHIINFQKKISESSAKKFLE